MGETAIRIIVIDPIRRTVEERMLQSSDDSGAQQMTDIIGGYLTLATTLPVDRGHPPDVLYVDDDDKYKDFFDIVGYGHQPFAGIGIIAGSNARGETVSAQIDLETVKSLVSFLRI